MDAVPSIFSSIVENNSISVESENVNHCLGCTELKALKLEISKLNSDHNKTIISLQNKIVKLEKRLNEKDEHILELIKKVSVVNNQQLIAEATANNLKNKIKELESQRYVPDNIPDVRILRKKCSIFKFIHLLFNTYKNSISIQIIF